MTPETAWKAACGELELQMTKATFNTWLRDARLLEGTDGTFRIGVRNDYARDWLENRLAETVNRTLSAIMGQPTKAIYVVVTDELPQQRPLIPGADKPELPPGIELPNYHFDGFEAPKSNFVQIPHALIDEVLPHVRPTVGVLILVVFRRTVGVIVHADGSRKKEWPTTHRDLMLASGIESISTARLAVWESRAMGLLVYREVLEPERKQLIQQERLTGVMKSQLLFTLRPRWLGEPVDYPPTPRPKR